MPPQVFVDTEGVMCNLIVQVLDFLFGSYARIAADKFDVVFEQVASLVIFTVPGKNMAFVVVVHRDGLG